MINTLKQKNIINLNINKINTLNLNTLKNIKKLNQIANKIPST
jgi:hypothetical protein